MKVRAVAVAEERSNAIGTIELECTPHGLVVTYLGVGAFREGYAPAALTTGTRLAIPWASVREARVEGDQIFLSLDPAVTPHSRLVLTGFYTGEQAHAQEQSRQRWIIWLGAAAAAVVVAMLSALTLPLLAPRVGGGLAASIGGLGALGIILIGLLADRHVGRVGHEGPAARDAFAVELGRFLPSLIRAPTAPMPTQKPFAWPAFEGWLPRTTVAVVMTLTACTLGAVLTARWLLSPERARREPLAASPDEPRPGEVEEVQNVAAPPSLPPAPASIDQAAAAAPARAVVAVEGRCSCKRASSPLWDEPIPKLGVLVLSRKTVSGPVRKRLEIEIAAVNNSDQDFREIALAMEFFDEDPPPSRRKISVAHRAVYFEGPLGPGQAIKWSVQARGNSFEVARPIPGRIGSSGEEAAPANSVAQMLDANHRPVRLHGAMLLGYLGDPRAREAALKLREAMREDEAPYLDRLLRALSEIRTCDLDIAGNGPERSVRACVFNASRESRAKLALRARALDAKVDPSAPTAKPPTVVAEATYGLPEELPAQAGVVVRAKLDLSGASAEPLAFEAFADREDLLP